MILVVQPVAAYLVSKAADKFTDEVLSHALGLVVQTNRELLARLDQVDQQLTALLTGPFNTAMNYLDKANSKDRSAPGRQNDIQQAVVYLNEALGNEGANPERKAWIHWHLALCYTFLSQDEDARYHLRQSRQTASQAIETAQQAYQKEMHAIQAKQTGAENFAGSAVKNGYVFVYIIPAALALLAGLLGIKLLPYSGLQAFGCWLTAGAVLMGVLASVAYGLRKPRPVEQRVSPMMKSLIDAVEATQAVPRLRLS